MGAQVGCTIARVGGERPENPFFLYAKSPTPPFFFRVETEAFITDPFKPRIDPALIDKNDGATPPKVPVASVWLRKVNFFYSKIGGLGFSNRGAGRPDFCPGRTSARAGLGPAGARGAPRGPAGPWGPLGGPGGPWGGLGAPGGPLGSPGPYFGPWALRGPQLPAAFVEPLPRRRVAIMLAC